MRKAASVVFALAAFLSIMDAGASDSSWPCTVVNMRSTCPACSIFCVSRSPNLIKLDKKKSKNNSA
jgi:hypothetical protein